MKQLFFLLLLALACAPLFAQINNARMLSGVNYQTGTAYPFAPSDANLIVSLNNSAGGTATLSGGLTVGFGAGTVFAVVNQGTGVWVINCSACTINGLPSYTLNVAQSVEFYSDGQNYAALAGNGGSSSGGAFAATLGFTGLPPAQPEIVLPPDPTGTCDYPAAYYVPASFQICNLGNGFLVMNAGVGNFLVSSYRIPAMSPNGTFLVSNGVVPAWVPTNGDFELGSPAFFPNGVNGYSCAFSSPVTLTNGSYVTVCSWNLAQFSNYQWGWHCKFDWDLTTLGTSPTLAIAMNASVAPTSENGSAVIYTANSGTVTRTEAHNVSSTSTGDQAILTSASPGGTGYYEVETWGTIQALGGTFKIDAKLAGSTAAGNIGVSSTCVLR